MITKHEELVLNLISGHQTLPKQRLDKLYDNLTLVKTDVKEIKESHSFTQNDIDQRFSNKNEQEQRLEKELTSIKEEVGVVQVTKPTWAMEIHRNLLDLEDKSRRNNFYGKNVKARSMTFQKKNQRWKKRVYKYRKGASCWRKIKR